MTPTRLMRVGFAAVLVACIAPRHAAAEMKLNELDGEWSGSGTDRDSPFASMQNTSCRSKIRADVHRMNNEIVCSGPSGARKTIQLQITAQGDQITGELVQTQATGRDAPVTRKGSVSGRRIGDSAEMQVQFSGFTPNASAKFVLVNPSSYSLGVTSLGISLMDVTFKRTSATGQAAHPASTR